MRITIRYSTVLFVLLLFAACGSRDASLDALDALIDQHQRVQERYQARLDSIRASYRYDQMTDEEHFDCCGRFFDLYRGFNLDSQYVYVQQRFELASRLTDRKYIQAAMMTKAEVLMRSGMYHEALLSLDSVTALFIEPVFLPYYYYLRRTLYGLMEDFAMTDAEQIRYHRLAQAYRDSIIRVEEPGSFVQELVRADARYAEGSYDEALALLAHYTSASDLKDDQQGLLAITRAQIYRALGDHAAQKQQLILSASADLRGAVREYIALRELAVLLYYEGDIEHAYLYMTCAIEDANESNMRIRSFEISTIYPIVEQAHQRQETIRARMLRGLIVSITLLASLLSLFLIYSARKRKQLEALNILLRNSNIGLQQSNQIKTIYIGHYMEMTSLLIERFDNWRKTLNQSIKSGDTKRVQTEIASQRFTQTQLNTFYQDFDEAFLNIFPDFVDKVKDLLVDGTEFRIKEGEKLNTDLRVLCCIRLGITDSTQIASFLRYSLSTIYNSRTRMRNLAKGNRDEFEQKVTTL